MTDQPNLDRPSICLINIILINISSLLKSPGHCMPNPWSAQEMLMLPHRVWYSGQLCTHQQSLLHFQALAYMTSCDSLDEYDLSAVNAICMPCGLQMWSVPKT